MVSLSYCHMLLRVVNEWTKVQIWYTRCVLFLLALGWIIIWLWEMKRNPYSLIHAYNLDWLSSLHIIKLTLLLFMLIRNTLWLYIGTIFLQGKDNQITKCSHMIGLGLKGVLDVFSYAFFKTKCVHNPCSFYHVNRFLHSCLLMIHGNNNNISKWQTIVQ